MLKQTLRFVFQLLLSREQRRKIGALLLNEANADNNYNAIHNGEHALLRKFMARKGAAPSTAFDVGANVGDWMCEFLKLAPAESKVYAFEPLPSTFAQLQKSAGPGQRAVLVNAALSDKPGQAELFVSGELAGSNSLHRRKTEALGLTFQSVRTVELLVGDEFCAQRGIEQIDMLKIDTEGHEMRVLAGFTRMLSEHRIGVVQFEYGGTWLDARTQLSDAFEFFQPKGYALAKLFPSGLRFYKRYDPRLDTFQYANFVALRPELENWFDAV